MHAIEHREATECCGRRGRAVYTTDSGADHGPPNASDFVFRPHRARTRNPWNDAKYNPATTGELRARLRARIAWLCAIVDRIDSDHDDSEDDDLDLTTTITRNAAATTGSRPTLRRVRTLRIAAAARRRSAAT